MKDPKEPTLLDAVDALSKAKIVTHFQPKVGTHADERDGEYKKRTDPPLLDWLRDAISSNIGGDGGGKQARERTPMDVGAFALYETIDGRLRSWLLELGARPGKEIAPTQLLRTWYTLWIGRPHTEGLDAWHMQILEGWEVQILDKLDPPKRIPITAPCPICGNEWVNVGLKLNNGEDDPDDIERVRALNAVERDKLDDSFAFCSACDRVWKGVSAMRSLRISIDDADPYERRTVTGPTKRWANENTPPDAREGWELDVSRGAHGFDRFEDRIERYWRRLKRPAMAESA